MEFINIKEKIHKKVFFGCLHKHSIHQHELQLEIIIVIKIKFVYNFR